MEPCKCQAPLSATSVQTIAKFPSAQKMHVQMKNNLSALFVAVNNHTKSLFINLFQPGDLLCGGHHCLKISYFPASDIQQRGNMFFGNDNNVNRGHGVYIVKRQNPFILIYLVCRNLPSHYPAEYAILHPCLLFAP